MSQMKPYCFKCGAELDPDTIYCPVCGRLQRSMVVRNVEASGTAGARAQGGARHQEATSEEGRLSQVSEPGYQPSAEQAYGPATEPGYGGVAEPQPYYQPHYEQHDQRYAQAGEQPYYQAEQGYPDDQPSGAEGGQEHYGGEGQHHYQPTYDAYGQEPVPGYDPSSYAPDPHAYEQGYAPEPPGDYQQSYAPSAPVAEPQLPPEPGYAPQASEEPPYPYPEGHLDWQAPTEPPPPPPPPPPRFVPFAGQPAAGTRTPPLSSGGGAGSPTYTVAGGPQPTPGAELPVPGGPIASNLPERLTYPGHQAAPPSSSSWMRRFAMGVAGLLVLFLVGLGIGHVFGGSSSAPAGSQSSRFTQLPSQAPAPPTTAPAQTQPSPATPLTPAPSVAPTVTGSATWHTVNAQILNGGKCSISQGCEAGGTFRNTGGLGNGVVTFNITDRSYQTVYASCTAPLPQTDTGGTATVSCWANSDQLDQLFESNPNAYIYLQVQLGTS